MSGTLCVVGQVSKQELEVMRVMIRDLLASGSDGPAAGQMIDTCAGSDWQLWRDMAAKLGLQGVVVPRQYGGSGYGIVAASVVAEELGRALCRSPLLSSMIATWAVSHVTDSLDCEAILPALASGRQRATAALAPFRRGTALTPGVRSVGGRLTGVVSDVLDGEQADWIVVEAMSCSGAGLYLVDAADAGVIVRRRDATDRTRPLADVELDSVPAQWFAGAETAMRVRAVAALLLASSQLGGAEAALDPALHRARAGDQFVWSSDVPARDAVQLANLYLLIESARGSVQRAAAAADREDPDLKVLASVAKVSCSFAYVRAAETMMPTQGQAGIGRNLPAHLRQSRTDQSLFGSQVDHRDELARVLGLIQ